jgi:hypothetical protein
MDAHSPGRGSSFRIVVATAKAPQGDGWPLARRTTCHPGAAAKFGTGAAISTKLTRAASTQVIRAPTLKRSAAYFGECGQEDLNPPSTSVSQREPVSVPCSLPVVRRFGVSLRCSSEDRTSGSGECFGRRVSGQEQQPHRLEVKSVRIPSIPRPNQGGK